MLILVVIVFVLGYLLITLEHSVKVNKAAVALLTGVLCWSIYAFIPSGSHEVGEQLIGHLGEISGILFFLMGAMTIVELVDAHDGFDVITAAIKTTNKRKLLWIICLLAFFLSAILDNLTTTIVLVSLLSKLISEKKIRMLFIGMVVIAANAGGAWSPIGDVTTTMLWIGGQVSASNLVLQLFIPSMVSLLVPLIIVSFMLKGNSERPRVDESQFKPPVSKLHRNVIFIAGIAALIFVPIFKTITHLPPFMGMLFGLGVLWVISEILHKDKDEAEKHTHSVLHALRKIDMPSILFFLGILVSIAAMQSTGQLQSLAHSMNETIGNTDIIVISIGLLSSIVDNVPLVAASMGMYDLQTYPMDHYFWIFLAYAAGTGGSALIIGSAAGVAAMGMEKISFFWYVKNISWLALIGYFAGAGVFILQSLLLNLN
jgi:Na+/H+ antiporter NhaD/arsenite permease-like protein